VQGVAGKAGRAVRIEQPPRLDGTLDDPAWKAAEPILDFSEREPHEGQPPTEKTEVRVLYTRRAVYFGITCYDSQPDKIVAQELRRDVNQDLDDHFEILIDSTHDRRNAYVFQVNPLGTQRDGLITEERGGPNGDEFDPGWDGVWTSAARITSTGWTATIAIPFSTLNFTQSQDVIWGMNFKRFIRRKNEEDLWAAFQRIYGLPRVSEAGELRGISDIDSGRLFIVKPYLLGGWDRLSGSGNKALHTGGLDVKYGLRSNLVLNVTANTDFADSDVDQQQFNLTPFKIFLPEKRPFFLENAGIFDFSTGGIDRMFFSRQIGIDPVTGEVVPINFGAKLTGSLGPYQLGVMDVETRSSGPNPFANYAVVRAKRSLFGGSYIGAMIIDKRSGNAQDPYNQSGGLDMRLVFKNLVLFGWGAATRSPGLSGGNTDAGLLVNYDTNLFHFFGARDKIGPNYNPEVGFLPHQDVKETLFEVRLSPRPKIDGVRELDFDAFLYNAPNTRNVLQIQQLQQFFAVNFNNGGFFFVGPWWDNIQRINSPFQIYKNISIPDGLYHFTRHHVEYGSGQDRPITYNFFQEFGSYYGGSLSTTGAFGNYRVNPRFSVSLGQIWNRFRLPVGNFSVNLASVQANYSFSRFLSFTSLVQMDTANNQAMSANFRLRYNYRPDSDLYVIYNVGTQFQSLTNTNQQELREQRFAVKFTYSFQPELGRARREAPAASLMNGETYGRPPAYH
jgi:Domain of unknown function (DUF5916)/Carbohydrate family 9 binding domain-like